MKMPPIPRDEELRLKDLYSLNILDSAQETEFDELVELAGEICDSPISLITLVDKDRQWFKAKKGIQESETSREVSFCSHAILQEKVFTVEDATRDERFRNNPLVVGNLNIRFYAGAPIISPAGYKLGTLCLLDRKPKVISKKQKYVLSLLAKQVSRLLEIRKKNELLRKRAEEIIALKTRSLRKTLHDHEKLNGEISYDLHEGIAQSIASSLFYVRTAERSRDGMALLLTKARTQLEQVLCDVRTMSYKITPAGYDLLTIAELVQDFIDKTSGTYRFAVKLERVGVSTSFDREITVLVIRCITEWLAILNRNIKATAVRISLSFGKQLELQITDDDNEFSLTKREDQLLQEPFADSIHAYGGSIVLRTVRKNFNLKVKLPTVLNLENT